MSDAMLLRVLGVAAILGGILRIASAFIPWVPGQAWLEGFYFAIDVLLLFGLMGIYFAHRARLGVFGFVAFVIAETGIASIVGPDGVMPEWGVDVYQFGVLIVTAGLTLFAVALLTTRSGAPWAPLSWLASAVVGVATSFGGDPEMGFLVGGVLFGLGFALAGLELMRRN
jgi:hypothetical protein